MKGKRGLPLPWMVWSLVKSELPVSVTLDNISKLCEPQLLLVDIPGGTVVKNLPANAGDKRCRFDP